MMVVRFCLSVGVSSFASSSHSFVRSFGFVRFVLFLSDDETADRRNLSSIPTPSIGFDSRFQIPDGDGTIEPINAIVY